MDADNFGPLVDPAVPDSRATTTMSRPPAAVRTPLAQPEVQEKPLKILCIDDDPVVVKSIALRLKPYGIEVKATGSGMEGFFLGLREKPRFRLLI